MEKLGVLDLFSGIGGFSLGLERTGGFVTKAFCEIEDFPRRVLAKHWPGVPCYRDVRELNHEQLVRDGVGSIDIITGGFPCQDISVAGKRAGIDGETRSGLWSEISRLVGELRPRIVFVENVSNLLAGPSDKPGGWFARVLGDLASLGYDAEWHCLQASRLGAPHHRDRAWIVAHRHEIGWDWPGLDTLSENVIYDRSQWTSAPFGNWRDVVDWLEQADAGYLWETANEAYRGMDDGLLRGLDRPDIGALGNAVIPQIPELIGRAILASLSTTPNTARE